MCFDPNSPICQRWAELGGMAALGATVSGPTLTPDGRATFQEFAKGALFLTSTGVYRVSKAIFEKWKSLASKKALDGTNLRDFVGYPAADDFTFKVEGGGGVPNVNPGRCALFEGGFIVAYGLFESTTVLVYGELYEAFLSFGLDAGGASRPLAADMAAGLGGGGRLGLPLADEEAVATGGTIQRFQRADIYLQPSPGADAFVVLGAIRERWLKLGGVASQLGFPTSNEIPINREGAVVGQVQQFRGGFVYWSQQTGAWEVLPPILVTYNAPLRGGPLGPLGFPVSGRQSSPTGLTDYNNFENGVIAWRRDGSLVGDAPTPGASPLGAPRVVLGMQFFVTRFAGTGGDELGSDLEIFVNSTVSASGVTLFNGRLPGPPFFISANSFFRPEEEVNLPFTVPGPVTGETVVRFDFQGRDRDTGPSDTLGRVAGSFDVDTYWGLTTGMSTRHNDAFHVTCGMRDATQPIDPGMRWRIQAFWQFGNASGVFPTRELTTKHYADTFRDIDDGTNITLDPVTWVNEAWESIYYHAVYKSLAETGHCFGMCTLAARALANSVFWNEPIFRFPITTPGLVDEIKISHGLQAGADVIYWVVGQFLMGQTHNPKEVFEDSLEAWGRGDYPVLCVTDGFFGGLNHVVMPYAWNANGNPWVISVANPNFPNAGDAAPGCVITIDPDENTFTLARSGGAYTGGTLTGGRLYYIPLSRFSSIPRTPGYEALILLYHGLWLVLGNGTETVQISNDKGQTFYDPGLKGRPTRWEQIRRAGSGGLPGMVRVPFLDCEDAPEVYFGRGDPGDLVHRITAKAGAAAGADYHWALHSPELSVALKATPPGKSADIIRVKNRRAFDPLVQVELADDGAPRDVELAISAGRDAKKSQRFRVQGVTTAQGRQLTLRLTDRGESLLIENAGGPSLSCKVTAGKGSARVVNIPAAESVRIKPDWKQASAPFQPEPFVHGYRSYLETRGLPAQGGIRERFPAASSLRNLLRL